jgi:hypothetical protein
VYQLIEGMTVEPTVKINSLIETIKKVTYNNLLTVDQPQESDQSEQ